MIYFIQLGRLPYVKVGVSDDTASRLTSLQCAAPVELRLLATFEGSYSEELLIHRLLHPHRCRNEWFGLDGAFDLMSVLPEHGEILPVLQRMWSDYVEAAERTQLTDEHARRLFAKSSGPVIDTHGPTSIARQIGCDERTLRRARDQKSTPGLACAFNLLDIDSHALDALIAAKGFMLVPLVATTTDVIPAAGAAIHRIGQNRSPLSEGGADETDRELISTEAENDALLASVLERRSLIAEAKLRRAAA